jgi:hypothetical protein
MKFTLYGSLLHLGFQLVFVVQLFFMKGMKMNNTYIFVFVPMVNGKASAHVNIIRNEKAHMYVPSKHSLNRIKNFILKQKNYFMRPYSVDNFVGYVVTL